MCHLCTQKPSKFMHFLHIFWIVSNFWPFVPFVNRPFESEIHGTVNFTQFCCVLLVTWCYCVLLSCYLRPK